MATEAINGASAPRPPHRNRVPPPSCCPLPLTAAIVRACAMIGASSSLKGRGVWASGRRPELDVGQWPVLRIPRAYCGEMWADPTGTTVIVRTKWRNSAASDPLRGSDRRLRALQLLRQERHRAVPGELG